MFLSNPGSASILSLQVVTVYDSLLQYAPPGGRPQGRPEDVEGAEVAWDGGGDGGELT